MVTEDAPTWAHALAGRMLVFEGPDGSGKSTQLRRFVDAVRTTGLEVVEVREPGGTEVGEKIRRVLLDHLDEEMSPTCEMLLYMASRAQLVAQRIEPALARGALVVADRFVSSTLAYQGAAGGVSTEAIRAVAEIACAGLEPDLVLIFDVDEETAARRLSPLLDRMEAKGRAFHARVRAGYHEQARAEPGRHLIIDARLGEEEVWRSLLSALGSHPLTSPR